MPPTPLLINNVKGYGAVGNGTTDDTAAIVSALAAGGPVFFPAGSYRVTANISIPANTLIFGEGPARSKIVKTVSGTFSPFSILGSNCAIEKLGFDLGYPSLMQGTAIGVGASATAVTDIRIQDCEFLNVGDAGILISNAQRVWVERNRFNNIGSSGIMVNNDAVGRANKYIWIVDNNLTQTQQKGVSGNGGIQCVPGPAGSIEYVWIMRNHVNSKKVAIGADQLQHGWITHNRAVLDSGGGECIALTGNDVEIANNNCQSGSTAACILFWAMANGFQQVRIHHNRTNGGGQGVACYWAEDGITMTDIDVESNFIRGASVMGIQAFQMAGVTTHLYNNFRVRHNDVAGAAPTPISLANPSSGNRPMNYGNLTTANPTGVFHNFNITGSRANPEQALADLLNELQASGIISNSTTA